MKEYSHHANGNTKTFKNFPPTEPILILSSDTSFHFVTTNCNLTFRTETIMIS